MLFERVDWSHLNQMLEFLLNRPTTNQNCHFFYSRCTYTDAGSARFLAVRRDGRPRRLPPADLLFRWTDGAGCQTPSGKLPYSTKTSTVE